MKSNLLVAFFDVSEWMIMAPHAQLSWDWQNGKDRFQLSVKPTIEASDLTVQRPARPRNGATYLAARRGQASKPLATKEDLFPRSPFRASVRIADDTPGNSTLFAQRGSAGRAWTRRSLEFIHLLREGCWLIEKILLVQLNKITELVQTWRYGWKPDV